jgi:ubiquinone/menaquinone biosynthesis C-methylase UbiE
MRSLCLPPLLLPLLVVVACGGEPAPETSPSQEATASVGLLNPHAGNPALALGTPGATTLAPTLAVLDYLEAPGPEALERALGIVQRAEAHHVNAYLEAFLLAEAGRDDELARMLEAKLPGREPTWRFFFREHRDQLPALLALQPREICYLHRVELQIREHELGEGALPASTYTCPVDGTPYQRLAPGERVGSAGHRCAACDAARARAEAERLWPVFQQIAWDSHGQDRIGGWLERDGQFVPPERVFDALGFEPGMAIADIGAGEGYFSLPFAQRLGPDGQLWAEDIFPGFLDFIAWRAEDLGLDNVHTVLGAPTDVMLPEASMDRVFVCEVYKYVSTNAQRGDAAHLEATVRPFATSLRRALKDDGRLVFVEHDDPVDNPKAIAPEVIVEQLEGLGFALVERSDAFAPLQAVLVFEKR